VLENVFIFGGTEGLKSKLRGDTPPLPPPLFTPLLAAAMPCLLGPESHVQTGSGRDGMAIP
jgi:hypothetical protein